MELGGMEPGAHLVLHVDYLACAGSVAMRCAPAQSSEEECEEEEGPPTATATRLNMEMGGCAVRSAVAIKYSRFTAFLFDPAIWHQNQRAKRSWLRPILPGPAPL